MIRPFVFPPRELDGLPPGETPLRPFVLPLVPHLRSTLALADATRAADRALMGRRVKPSLLRDTLVRLILAEHEERRSRCCAFYHRHLADRLNVAMTTSYAELKFLEMAKVIRLDCDDRDARRYRVHPTERLLTWAAEHIPRLASAGGAE